MLSLRPEVISSSVVLCRLRQLRPTSQNWAQATRRAMSSRIASIGNMPERVPSTSPQYSLWPS